MSRMGRIVAIVWSSACLAMIPFLLIMDTGASFGGEISNPPAPEIDYTAQRKGLYEAARVYGKAGCGDFALAEMTARYALRANLPPGIVAAKVAKESSCNPLAVSHKGAVGLAQIRVVAWKGEYDFARVNLFNPEDSLRVGTEILGALVARYGLHEGLRRYNGAGGKGEEVHRYADGIIKLAGK